ncbi:MAG: RNA polymerase sigma factor [Bacteroidales bacterium]
MNVFRSLNQPDRFTGSLVELQDQLFFYALQLTEDREDALDLVQETSYKALKNRTKLNDREHLRAWLYTILRNTYINYLRSSHYKQLTYDPDEWSPSSPVPEAAASEQPDRVLMNKELHHMIRLLPAAYGEPIKMFLTGYSYKEIAEKMDIPIGTVKSRIHLGKKQIRKVYTA